MSRNDQQFVRSITSWNNDPKSFHFHENYELHLSFFDTFIILQKFNSGYTVSKDNLSILLLKLLYLEAVWEWQGRAYLYLRRWWLILITWHISCRLSTKKLKLQEQINFSNFGHLFSIRIKSSRLILTVMYDRIFWYAFNF